MCFKCIVLVCGVAVFTVGSNFIMMNRIPHGGIKETRPGLFKPFAVHVLMHEYIHSQGYLDEQLVRQMVFDISRTVMGDSHLATQLAQDLTRFIPDLAYPDFDWRPNDFKMELVEGFDRGRSERGAVKKWMSLSYHSIFVISSAINSACLSTVSVASACISGG